MIDRTYGAPDVVIDKVVYFTEQGLGLELNDDNRIQNFGLESFYRLQNLRQCRKR